MRCWPSVADAEANLTRFSKQRGGVTGGSSYPMLRLVALVACGTRSVIDAVFGPTACGLRGATALKSVSPSLACLRTVTSPGHA
jgi:hypothetical protein